jgi:hypothetical protein
LKVFYIIYPTGSHGQFLTHVLNHMTGHDIDHHWFHDGIFDRPLAKKYTEPNNASVDAPTFPCFVPDHHYHTDMRSDVVNITVQPSSYLKYLAMVFTRHNTMRFTLQDWENHALQVISKNHILRTFANDLKYIANHQVIQQHHLREWCRLNFFDHQARTIKLWISDSLVDASYKFDFENFYSGKLITHCKDLMHQLGVPVINEDLEQWQTIFQRIPYRDLDCQFENIQRCILDRQFMAIPDNFILQSYLDHWLCNHYGVTVLMPSRYWSNTYDLLKAYDL